jgi:hypothetical protein
MSIQHNRIYALTIGNVNLGSGVRITNVPYDDVKNPVALQITFNISKNPDNKKNKNSGSIAVYNLSPETIALLEEGFVTVQLEVGYVATGLKLLISGNVREFSTTKRGSDRVTTLSIGEAFTALNNAFISKYVPSGSTDKELLDSIVAQMPGVSLGGSISVDLSNPLTFGYSLHGTPQEMLDDYCNARGFEYRCSNNVLTLTSENGLANNSKAYAVVLNKDTGMIDIPFQSAGTGSKAQKDKAKAMGVQVKSLLNAAIQPGSLIKIESEEAPKLSGFYRIGACRYTGDFRGNDWYVESFCNVVKGVLAA